MLHDEINLIAQRLRGLREMEEVTPEEMAAVCDMTAEEYLQTESGEEDFSFTFLYNCAKKLGVDMTELLTGAAPTLSFFTVVKAGGGMPIKRRQGFAYRHLAALMKGRIGEPFVVTAPYSADAENGEIALSRHKGQEFDYVLRGKLRVRMENHEFVLEPGDSVYYDSSHGHGMVATDGEDCEFLAVVMEDRGDDSDAESV